MITYPALKGKFGKTEYYVVTMKVSEFVDMVMFPAEIENWDLSIEERFQRKLDKARVNRLIAPYFENDENRFSGSLVVAVDDMEMKFEGVDKIADNLPYAYGSTADNMGFLSMTTHKLIPLDGQHRAKAFQIALENDKSTLGDDKISVIIIKFDRSLSRYIFNKINKYARPTSKAAKLITDDDDALAVMTRELITNDMIPKRLVNTESSSLNKSAYEFTMLSTLYDANRTLLSLMSVPVVGKPEDMGRNERVKNQKEVKAEWKRLLNGIDEWKNAVKDPSESGDEFRMNLRKNSILGRPIGQLSLVKAYTYSCNRNKDREKVVEKLNMIDWKISTEIWKGVLIKPNGRMMYGARVSNTASKFISHLVGTQLSKSVKEQLLDYIYGKKRTKHDKLPKPVGKI